MEKKLEMDTYDEPSGQSSLYELTLSYLSTKNNKDEKKKATILENMKKMIDAGAKVNLLSKIEDREETPLHMVCKMSSLSFFWRTEQTLTESQPEKILLC